jgi:hypothetical protein
MALPLGAGSTDLLNQILFASAWLPVVIIGFLCWWFFRAARRNDRAEAAEAAAQSTPPHQSGDETQPEE